MGRDCVVFEERQRNRGVYAYHEGSDTKLELERVDGVFDLQVELVPYKEINAKSISTGPYSSLSALQQTGNLMGMIAKTEHPEHAMQYVPQHPDQVDRVDRARLVEHCRSRDDSLSWNLSRVKQGETIPSRRQASTRLRTKEARLEPLSVGGGIGSSDQSRDVTHPTAEPLGERPMFRGGRDRTQREDELRRQVKG